MNAGVLKKLVVLGAIVVACVLCHTAGSKSGVTSSIYNIADFGAAGDGKTLCTEAIQKAIDRASESGGGKVVIGPGHWLSGTIVLKSGVTLHLEKEGVLLGSTDVADYPEKISAIRSYTDKYVRRSLIYAEDCDNISITGSGTIDGNGGKFPRRYGPKIDPMRPYLIRVINCRDVLVEGIRVQNSGMWMQHYLVCQRVRLRGLTVYNHANYNNDGMDIDGCDDVEISECMIDTDDDGLCLKSTQPKPTSNVTISNCVIRSHCTALKFGTESTGGFNNVTITDCKILSPKGKNPFFGYPEGRCGIALELVDGGCLENISISNVSIDGVSNPLFMRLGNRARLYKPNAPKPGVGTFRNVELSNIIATNAGKVGFAVSGINGNYIENVSLTDISLEFSGGGTPDDANRYVAEREDAYPESDMFGVLPAYGLYARHARNLKLDNVRFTTKTYDARKAIVLDDVEQFTNLQQSNGDRADQKKPIPVDIGKKELVVISEHQGPVIGPDHPDVKASGNRSGFETGQLIKHQGAYHMFVNEMFGRHHLDLRCSHWISYDAVNWKRQSTLVNSIPGRRPTNPRSEVWLTGVEYDNKQEFWNIFYVAYRGGDGKKGEIAGSDYEGKIWRARSKVKGPNGIGGPYEDIEIILQPDENSQKWEGQQAVDSFNPYKVGDKWYAFYGGHYHKPRGPWPVGLAVADKLSGPWKRMAEGFNPVPIVKTFIENPVVSRLPDGRWMATFDSLGDREIGYSISKDGITWPPETRLTVQTGDNTWARSGDHDMRTPLCALREDDGTCTVIYTARMKDKSFWAVGKCTLGWATDKNADISREQVVDACRKAADWQLKNPHKRPIGDWAQGPFINGLFAISKMPSNDRYLDEVIKIGEKEKWQVITTIHPANDHCTPQTWLDIYKIKKDPRMIEPTRKALDEYIKAAESLDDNLDFTKANRKKWSWCDALYMSPPTFARMYRLTGDEKYRNYLHTWWPKVSDYYYDTDEHLYYRDETFFKKREPNGKKVFWSRGNGWVVGGLVRVLQYLEKDDPKRAKYIGQLKEMCSKLAEIQSEDGLWRSGLLDPVAHTQPETSGSAFFVYAMAYGVNERILDRDRFLPVIEKAWAGLCRHLQDDGRFTGIQPVGDGPRKYNSNNTMPYGVGAFLLTGSEVYKLSKETLKQSKQQKWHKVLVEYNYTEIAKAYADYMIAHGRDRYGKVHSPLFVTAMDRKTATVFKHGHVPYPHVIAKPYAPGLRRDHKMRPQDRTYSGGNPLEDLSLYRLLYRLSELTGNKRYGEEADKSIAWFLEHAQSPATGLYAWGSHMYWDVHKDQPIYANTGRTDGGYGGHEYNYVWPYWDQNPDALKRFAHGLWNHQITDKKTGRFSRHALYHKHGPGNEWFEFPQTGVCYMDAWAREYGRSGDPQMKTAIQTLLKLYRSMRDPKTGAMAWCTAEGADRREVSNVSMNLFMATTLQDAAAFVEERDPALAEEMRKFVRFMDDEYLSNDYDKILDVAGKGILGWYTVADRTCMAKGFTPPPDGVDASVGFPLTSPDGSPAASLYYLTPWFPGRSYAEFALLLRDRYERCDQKHKPTYRRALLDTANIYMTIGPEVQFAQYPDNIADVVELLRYVYKITDNVAYLHWADYMMRLGIRMFFDDTSPLPKIANFDDWYESSLKNESSVAILRQMLELSLDLKALPEAQRTAPYVVAEKCSGLWQAKLDDSKSDMIVKYGSEKQHELYLSQAKFPDIWRINLSDTITRIPTAAEADKLNGRMKKFTGKGHTADNIAYGGFKNVPRQVALVIRNTGKKAARLQVKAILHDTYHDNGQVQSEKVLEQGQQESFILIAPAKKWIRRLSITSKIERGDLSLERFAFVMTPRNKLVGEPGQDATASPSGTTYYVDAAGGDNDNPGIVPEKAWKSLAPVNAMILAPGDKVLLKAGCEFAGPLIPQGNGTEGKPIVVDKYGHGANPIINGEGKVENTIRLHNQHHWEIRNLTVTNTDGGSWDDDGRKLRRGIYVTASDVGDVNHIYLQNLEIRDVRGMYRFAGNQTNGGIICQVTGKKKKTRFVDLRIEDCVFRTKSIDRYPVVVTSSWKKEPVCEVVWKNNTLDHAGRAHIVMPADQWPRKLVYYFDPEVRKVFPLEKTAAPVSPFTGRVGCEDIFSEMAARLKRSWHFYEATRIKKDSWLFTNTPGGKVHHVDEGAYTTPSYPLAYYGELRAFGFIPPWLDRKSPKMHEVEDAIIEKWISELETVGLNREADWTVRNRVFANSGKWPLPRTGKAFLKSLRPGGVDPDFSTRESTLKYFNSLPWTRNPYSTCSRIGHALDLHMAKRKLAGKDPFDESYYYVKELIDKQFQTDGYWGGQKANFVNRTSGNMKILCTYARFDWKIPSPKKIIDYHLSGATEQAGFKGSGCSAFNQMHPLAAIFRQYPELAGYRGEEIDRYTAMTFMTFLATWDEKMNFYGNTWLGKHNNGVPMFMAHLMLDLPIMRVSTVYNWRENPVITRQKNGRIKRNKVIYQKKGSNFHG